jgi:hypothetical protein
MCLITLKRQEVDESEVGGLWILLKECDETSFYNTNEGLRFHMFASFWIHGENSFVATSC